MASSIRHDAPVLLIGLGRFGAAAAAELDLLGREVLAVDSSAALVQEWADQVTHTVQADATQLDALRQIGAEEFQIAIVAVGSQIEASVLITANLVELGVAQIWSKAVSPSHGKILSRIGAHHVIYPEAEAGERIARLVSGRMLDFIQFDDDFVLVKMHAPRAICGKTLTDSGVRTVHKVTVVGIKRPGEPFTHATEETVVHEGDIIVVSGGEADVQKFASLDD
ncbi:potassium channel family protein [Gryllotalpicola protaetiae]|uniref:TrkA family potassium uptake protein n=1 Tax=Gryllotalpicola protaetiae TaxID=2419771 RepID=A0A387BP56_9MICO|nr:TrkA family potassium uptake protein [Gryllotalpicola protaetiae]AYG03824.1 TrkA family potassium uptake protein [Gryllotalpicola protaetiae]